MSDVLLKVFADAKIKKIGFEANFTTYGQIDAVMVAAKESKDVKAELVPLENVMSNIRKVKDDTEVDLIRKSVGIAEEAFTAIRDEIKVGLTENYLAGLLGFELRSRGASSSSFPVIVAAGANSSLPHYRPDDSLIHTVVPLLLVWGALYK